MSLTIVAPALATYGGSGDASTGRVTIKGTGTAAITASFAGDDREAESVSYTVEVSRRSSDDDWSSSESSSESYVQMWRLYNPNSGEHFYTASTGERDLLIAAKWNYEGIAWYGVK